MNPNNKRVKIKFLLQTKNTALCPTLLHLDASSQLGIIGTKSVESNSSQQSLVPEGFLGSGGFSGPKSDGGSTEWGLGGRGGRVDEGRRKGGGGGAVTGGGQAGRANQEGGGKLFQSGVIPTQSTKSSWRFSRTTSGPSTTTLDPLRADLDSVLSAVIRLSVKCLRVKCLRA